MNRKTHAHRIAVILTLAGTLLSLAACRRQTASRQGVEMARAVAGLSVTPDQARLWRDAADKGLAVSLQRVPLVERPVQVRSRSTVAGQQVLSEPVDIPTDVSTAVRIVAAPAALGPDGFSGTAEVLAATQDRIELNLGQQRTLALLARAGGKPIPTRVGDRVRIQYRARSNPRVPYDIFAIKTTLGDGMLQVVQGGARPVRVTVPLFGLTATQTGQPPSMAVDVRVDQSQRTMSPGETAQVGSLTVTLIGSSAHTSETSGRIEGSPYTINLIAWRSR